MAKSSLLLFTVVVTLCLSFCLGTTTEQFEVKKSAVEVDGVFVVTVEYRAISANPVHTEVQIIDELPVAVNLHSGALVVTAEKVTSEWQQHTYRVNAPNSDFSLEEREKQVILPAAEVRFNKPGAADSIVLKTEPVPIIVSLQIPKGKYSGPLYTGIIVFFTLALPVLAATFLNQRYHTMAARSKRTN
eukprot:gnl/Hemi2/27662_TR9146_c1_g1_i1.p1 gnl/Hemi2/27662_TR9146_c1_g1~~gnl/Hemi2/27662_TR9146_c1_g1_i1.p1  ORF type:complete len:208 (+),score=53.15 gnl/Hemi2/27662_TR9146_c1_g1_i1:62-625(+)